MIIIYGDEIFEQADVELVGPFVVHRTPTRDANGDLQPTGPWIVTHVPTWLGVYRGMPERLGKARRPVVEWARKFFATFPEFATMVTVPLEPEARRYVEQGREL
jgi:hypothetical protein